jgi:hypothetical protein
MPPVFDIQGADGSSRLTIKAIHMNHSGVYVCQVGGATASFVVEVEMIGKYRGLAIKLSLVDYEFMNAAK